MISPRHLLLACCLLVPVASIAKAGCHKCACAPAPTKTVTLCVCDPCTGCTTSLCVCVPCCCEGEACLACCSKGHFGRTILTYKWACGHTVEVVVNRRGEAKVR